MRTLVQRVLDAMYPPFCVFCNQLLSMEEWDQGVCIACEKEIPFLVGNKCEFCGRELQVGTVCHTCLEFKPVFARGSAAFSYEELRDTIFRFKFDGVKGCGRVFGRFMAEFMLKYHEEWIHEIDCITEVPLHIKKEKERGFNQVDILCKNISEYTGVVYEKGILTRVKKTIPQNTLSAKERYDNLNNAFISKNCEGKHILLVDDIFTTGATVNACSRVLYRAGAKKVSVFCLAVTETGKSY